ncbi:MAG TPA: endonuclease/exonuclease/phosphatase family protein, partial [Cryptosporangiaceae bacterium]|nr:endonuclease/exonuclease/phosphatase family protein [Cryptosporangiaceae bacterium]
VRGRAVAVALAVVLATLASGFSAPAAAAGTPKVTVMTRNLFLGANLAPAIEARTMPEFMAANAAIFAHVQKVDFTERAKVLAREIADAEPDLLGLQEVSLWRTGPLGDPAPATTVVYDYLALLRTELDNVGAPYDVVISQQEADVEGPASDPYNQDIRLTERDVILVRRGADLELSNPRSANFLVNLPIPVLATGGVYMSTRGWTSVDAVKGGKPFRFVNTHLEAFNAQVRVAQATELLAGPLALPPGGTVVLVGDLNSGPELPKPENRLAYQVLVVAGMVDTWLVLHPGDPGYTASYGDDLDQPADALEHRIDMVMIRGTLTPIKSRLTGNDPDNRTAGGLWGSDHLGHVAQLALSG